MKKSDLQAALTKRIKAATVLEELASYSAETSQKHKQALAVSTLADLKDRARLQQLIELDAIATLSPKVTEALQAAEDLAEKELVAATNSYISATHGPRLRALNIRAEAKARAALKPHFTESFQLDRAVAESASVVETHRLSVSFTDAPMSGAVRFAQDVLGLSEKADALEKQLA